MVRLRVYDPWQHGWLSCLTPSLPRPLPTDLALKRFRLAMHRGRGSVKKVERNYNRFRSRYLFMSSPITKRHFGLNLCTLLVLALKGGWGSTYFCPTPIDFSHTNSSKTWRITTKLSIPSIPSMLLTHLKFHDLDLNKNLTCDLFHQTMSGWYRFGTYQRTLSARFQSCCGC